MKLKLLHIASLQPVLPIIQGGMAVEVSTGNLAGNVAKNGAVGVIGASGMEPETLAKEIRVAKEIAEGNGIIAINIMVAATDFFKLVKVSVKENIDLLIAGAGFSKDIFKFKKEYNIPFVPIVSAPRLAKISVALGADAIIVEGKEAGGHLGTNLPMKNILKEVMKEVKGRVPVIGAGGIIDGKDVCEVLNMGADGVQMATRFVLSEECTVDKKFKEYYLTHSAKDVVVFPSPVGLPGRSISTELVEKAIAGQWKKKCACEYQCLKVCDRTFCIIKALQRAIKGETKDTIIFAGERFSEIKDILPVKTIIDNIVRDINNC